MEKVIGIGGVFFRARDVARMSAWYRENLGICSDDGHANLIAEKNGRTAWALFAADTDYFGASGQSFMINYRVASLDKMLDQLRRNGVKIDKTEDYDYGRFAWVTDPEGNRVELWEDAKAAD